MSDESGDTLFIVNIGGKFKTLEDGTVIYNGGDVTELVTQATALYQGLPVSLYRMRIWYKMPYEDMNELKILCDGVDNFRRMCETSKWCKTIEIYLEVDEENEGDGENENEGETDGGVRNTTEESGQQRGRDETDGGVRNHSEESRHQGRDEMCDMEARVEQIVATFVDEEENGDYQRTPPTSDCEGENSERVQYDRWMKGSGELMIRQVFESGSEFREAVIEYALKGGWNIQFTRWAVKKTEAKCGIDDCKWRIYCSWEESVSQWMVKTFQDHHTCHKDGRCKILSERVIYDMFIHELRDDPLVKPISMQQRIHDLYNVAPSFDQCRKAKRRALDLIEEEYNEQYRRMKDYRDELLLTNRESTAELLTTVGENGNEVFDSFYMCFAGLRKTWKEHCRPIFGIDGCFLKSNEKGQLLAAVGRDANNQIYPFAWAVVQVENTDSWIWFIKLLKKDLDLKDGDGFTIISDRQKGLLKAVDQEIPHIEHRMCARHIYGNMKKAHPKKPRMKGLFWEVVESFNVADYEASLKKMKDYDVEVFDAFMSRNPKNCSRAYFETTSCCEDALNNFSESYNNAINKARSMPLIHSLETMRRQAMVRIEQRRNKTKKHLSKHSIKVGLVIAAEEKEVKKLRSVPSRPDVYEVKDKGSSHTVNMKEKTCKCRRWDLTGIPCCHVLRVVFDNKKKYKKEDFISDWYLTSIWQAQYINSIEPVNGMKFWKTSEESRIEAPEREVHKGRKRIQRSGSKVSTSHQLKGKKSHPMAAQCIATVVVWQDIMQLNARIWESLVSLDRKRNQKKTSNTEAEDMTVEDGPIPTQQTQKF